MATTSRIPLGLQAVFLASNRGKEVHMPPPEKAASKTFTRNWLFQGLRSIGTTNTSTRRTKGSRSRQDRPEKIKQFSSDVTIGASVTSVGSLSDEEPVARVHASKPIKIINQDVTPAKPKVCLTTGMNFFLRNSHFIVFSDFFCSNLIMLLRLRLDGLP
jgi:hypothetical protein